MNTRPCGHRWTTTTNDLYRRCMYCGTFATLYRGVWVLVKQTEQQTTQQRVKVTQSSQPSLFDQ